MLIQKFSRLLTVTGSILLLTASCNKGVNDDLVNPPAYAEFGTPNLVGSYFITNSTASVFKIPVGFTNVSNADRTIQLDLSSPTGAVAGTQYTAPTSVVVPAGQSLDSLEIKGLFAGYPVGRKDTLRIAITGGDEAVNTYNNIYKVVMQKYCDVVPADLEGAYDDTRETLADGTGPYGPYTTVIKDFVTLTPTTGKAIIENLWDSGLDDLDIYFDWTDPANFIVSMPDQQTGLAVGPGQPLTVHTSAGKPNSFSSCDQTISLSLDFIVNNDPSPGTNSPYVTNYKIKLKR